MTLDGVTKTPEGYIDTTGSLTRTGVFEYRRADGTVQRELRLPEHVFADKAIRSFHGQPLTLQHPSRNVDASSFKQHAVGVVLDPAKSDDGIHVRARVRVMDEAAVRAVEAGTKALSNGYETELVPIAGGVFKRDDYNGGAEVRADFLQTEITGNHTALVDRGRAGPTARLDSAGNEENEMAMTKEEEQALADAKAAADAAKKRADAAEARVAAFEAQQKQDAEAAKAKAKEALVARVAPIAKKDAAELAKQDEAAIMRAALTVMLPKLDTAKMDDASLFGALEVAFLAESARSDSASAMARAVGDAKANADKKDGEDEYASEAAYKKAHRDAAEFWKKDAK